MREIKAKLTDGDTLTVDCGLGDYVLSRHGDIVTWSLETPKTEPKVYKIAGRDIEIMSHQALLKVVKYWIDEGGTLG